MNTKEIETLSEREARIVWSRIAEPTNHRAAGLISVHTCDTPALDALIMVANYDADETTTEVAGWQEKLASLPHPARDLAEMQAVGTVLIPGDDAWPTKLDKLEQPPYFLWVLGNVDALNAGKTVGVVGARASTQYGDFVTRGLVTDLVERDVTIISGGAYGIDAEAHRAALARNGCTVAVMAGGLDRLYPTGNIPLLRTILDNNGAIVGEQPPGATPYRNRFLARNRLIAALSDAVVVVEAANRSGSLNTANHANSLTVPVGAVPGPITSMASNGTNELIRTRQAEMVTDAEQIINLIKQ